MFLNLLVNAFRFLHALKSLSPIFSKVDNCEMQIDATKGNAVSGTLRSLINVQSLITVQGTVVGGGDKTYQEILSD